MIAVYTTKADLDNIFFFKCFDSKHLQITILIILKVTTSSLYK